MARVAYEPDVAEQMATVPQTILRRLDAILRRLQNWPNVSAVPDEDGLPAFPKPDKSGRYPALEYTRVQFARNFIRERKALGLTQQALADLAGVPQETLSRLESGKHSISGKNVTKLEEALAAARNGGRS